MDMKLFQKDGKTYTQIRILIRSLWRWEEYIESKFEVDISNPSKKNSRYIYYEVEGDLINRKN